MRSVLSFDVLRSLLNEQKGDGALKSTSNPVLVIVLAIDSCIRAVSSART
jgi:hypothetical protein